MASSTLLPTRLRQARHARGLSQERLAQRIGVSRNTVVRWERGESLPGLDAIARAADVLGVSLPWLVGSGQEAA